MTLYMPLFRASTNLRLLTQLHAHLVIAGLHHDPQASTKLIESYSQMGSLHSASLAFRTFPSPDCFMWGVLIKCNVWSHRFGDAISLYHEMLCSGTSNGGFIFPSVLRACAGFGDLGIGAKVHGSIIKFGFDSDPVTETSLLSFYGELGCLRDARKVFDDMPLKDLVSWSSIISSHVENGHPAEGLEMFKLLSSRGSEVDAVTMLTVAQACGQLGSLKLARSVHGHVVRRRVQTSGSLGDCLVVMYSKCGDLVSAERVFRSKGNNSIISRTAVIHCYNHWGRFEQALEVFVKTLKDEMEPNVVTMMGVLSSCGGLHLLREGKSVHCYAIKKGLNFEEEDSIGPALVGFYSECNQLTYSRRVLHGFGWRNLISWNVLISAYVQRGFSKEAFELIMQMQRQEGLLPDSFSLSSSLSACADSGDLQLGSQIHGYCIKRRLSDEFIQNALIDMYSKCGSMDSAFLIFNGVQKKSVVTWNSMITGFSQNGNSVEAISLFDQMYRNCVEMNEVTFLTAIQACSNMGHLDKGKWLHHKLISYGVEKDLYIETALADMYAKCGDLRTAQRVFDEMPDKSVVTWSIMIAGYGIHGHIDAAVSLFDRMVEMGIRPNDVTFMNILSACSHSGHVDAGKFYFSLMENYSIEPNSEHFACMVDLLSRAGDVDGAYGVINSMPFPADASIWGALVNGCRIHHRMDMIQTIEGELLDVITDDTGYYTLLSNIYAEEGKWVEFRKVRSKMERTGLKKVPGYSTIELDNKVHRFGAGDTYHWRFGEICSFLENFQSLAQCQEQRDELSNPANESCRFPDITMNESEKLAIGYGTMRECSRTGHAQLNEHWCCWKKKCDGYFLGGWAAQGDLG